MFGYFEFDSFVIFIAMLYIVMILVSTFCTLKFAETSQMVNLRYFIPVYVFIVSVTGLTLL